jgi:predicted CXXCH cytochrome family protein
MQARNSKFSNNRRSFLRCAVSFFFLFFLVVCFLRITPSVEAISDITNTKHNLSLSGPGPLKSLTETRICVFCHTPHNATPDTPLWNKELQPQNYTFYTSSTLKSTVPLQPTGPTKLCLSCHDGTIALGTVVSGANLGLAAALSYPSTSYFGLNLSAHHPVSFSYSTALPNPELANVESLPQTLTLGGVDEVHCTTCHDPHDNTYGNFLVMDNSASQLCESCHLLTAWNVSAHSNCEDCHAPHFAVTPEWLLTFTSYDACLGAGCHSSEPVHIQSVVRTVTNIRRPLAPLPTGRQADIKSQVKKISGHHPQPGISIPSPRSQALRRFASNQVTCVDCHNPHQANKTKATAPNASGMLKGVSGVDRNGIEVTSVTYEYEVCFKCHGDYTSGIQYIPRVINATNMRLAFDPVNSSYHPIVSMGRNLNIPSIPSPLTPTLRASDIIYCTDCHRDDTGVSKGPHGSSFAPILAERYETADGTLESYENYALCYRCHNRTSILSDVSFKKKMIKTTATGGGHSGHLASGAPCSACHDPHGVATSIIDTSGSTGSHTHLINFDSRIVMPKPGSAAPVFIDRGTFSGSCTLVCHGKVHDNLSYP